MKCKICGEIVEKDSMDKLIGTYVKTVLNKESTHNIICPECQKRYKGEIKQIVIQKEGGMK